ncbi:unnamed protein product [Notodromas monacha]|uniref:PID domain-containing protein n=1 Tax=Notodromas monacha TaxID=399045 RepID=A0A7R9BH57_9CRUS|nr:unnamed protein product [Notodromas monacha]CAG0914340.1 unnamed protein product [Notodromas monacha]
MRWLSHDHASVQEIMMDHALRSISYIADIGDLVVLMARRRITQGGENGEAVGPTIAKTPKMICHIFESEELSAQVVSRTRGCSVSALFTRYFGSRCRVLGMACGHGNARVTGSWATSTESSRHCYAEKNEE